jgi:hypothetical protein
VCCWWTGRVMPIYFWVLDMMFFHHEIVAKTPTNDDRNSEQLHYCSPYRMCKLGGQSHQTRRWRASLMYQTALTTWPLNSAYFLQGENLCGGVRVRQLAQPPLSVHHIPMGPRKVSLFDTLPCKLFYPVFLRGWNVKFDSFAAISIYINSSKCCIFQNNCHDMFDRWPIGDYAWNWDLVPINVVFSQLGFGKQLILARCSVAVLEQSILVSVQQYNLL